MKSNRLVYLIILLITATLFVYGCDTGGGGGGGGSKGGNKTIDLSGGNGIANTAGNAGDHLYIGSYSDILIERTGTADTAFKLPGTVPSYISCTSEFNPLVSTAIGVYSDSDTLGAAGEFYMLYGSDSLYEDNGDGIADIDGTDAVVDCVDIPQGVSVTLSLNYDEDDQDVDGLHTTGADIAVLSFPADIMIAGTLSPALLNSASSPDISNSPDSGGIVLEGKGIYITKNGQVNATGGDSTSGRGGHGGLIDLSAGVSTMSYWNGYFENNGSIDCSGGNGATGFAGGNGCAYGGSAASVFLYSGGDLVNAGPIDTYGGNGDTGGDAGGVFFANEMHQYSTETISAHGGTGSSGAGGDAGRIFFITNFGSINISGDTSAIGGDGSTDGGWGGDITVYSGTANYATPTKISGDIIASGGNSTNDGDGGAAGHIDLFNEGGPILVSGDLLAAGGGALGAGSIGGDASFISIGIEFWNEYAWNNSLPTGSITLSGNIDSSGGDGAYGGSGGWIDIWHADTPQYILPEAYPITLLGYSDIIADGGSSTSGGAAGGNGAAYIGFETYNPDSVGGTSLFAGFIENNADISMRGGDGDITEGSGGTGGISGNISMYSSATDAFYDADNELNYVINTGDIDMSAGAGDIGGGDDNYDRYVEFYGYNKVENSGKIIMDSGAGTSTGGDNWASIYFASSKDVINTGMVSANGGDSSTTDGGTAENVWLAMYAGNLSKNSGAVYADGGDGDAATGTGGNGGVIDIWSQGLATSNTAPLSVQGGIAQTNGTNGLIFVDWMDITPEDGRL